jgi:hypothetical protein
MTPMTASRPTAGENSTKRSTTVLLPQLGFNVPDHPPRLVVSQMLNLIIRQAYPLTPQPFYFQQSALIVPWSAVPTSFVVSCLVHTSSPILSFTSSAFSNISRISAPSAKFCCGQQFSPRLRHATTAGVSSIFILLAHRKRADNPEKQSKHDDDKVRDAYR